MFNGNHLNWPVVLVSPLRRGRSGIHPLAGLVRSALAERNPAAPPPDTRVGVILVVRAGLRAGVVSARCSSSLRGPGAPWSAPSRGVNLGALKPPRAQNVCKGLKDKQKKKPLSLHFNFSADSQHAKLEFLLILCESEQLCTGALCVFA